MYWSILSQQLANTVEKVYHTSKWTYFYIQFVYPNYIFFDFDEKHELVAFWIFWDKVCLWNGCYVNISRMVLILRWIAGRLASVYSNKRLDVPLTWNEDRNLFYSYKITSSKTFSKSINSYNFQYSIRILRYTHTHTHANFRAFDSVNWGESTSNSFQDQYYPWDVHVTAIS